MFVCTVKTILLKYGIEKYLSNVSFYSDWYQFDVVYMYRQCCRFYERHYWRFDVTGKLCHRTALNPFFSVTKNGDIGGTCKRNLRFSLQCSHALEHLSHRGTEEHLGIDGSVDIINSTLGKALGGAAGGYTAGPKQLIDLLRNRSRPYLFSNTLPPPVVACANKVKKHVFDGNGSFTHCRIRTRIKLGLGLQTQWLHCTM